VIEQKQSVAADSYRGHRERPKSTIPALKELVTPAILVNGLIVSLLFCAKHLLLGLSVTGGLVVGLIVFSALHYFANNVFGVFFTQSSNVKEPLPGNMLFFGMLAGGKFIVVGILMYVLIAVLHCNIAAFVVGFLVTQICVSISVIKRLTASKITD
jgi:hypothetical protein